MYERLGTLLGAEPAAWCSPRFNHSGFGSFEIVGLSTVPRVASAAHQEDLAMLVLEEISEGAGSVIAFLTAVSRAKNRGCNPEEVLTSAPQLGDAEFARAYARYEELLHGAGLIDFDDMIAMSVRLLRDSESVRKRCQRRWPFILVDEYQDTSLDQFEFVRLLVGPRKNLCVVGDDDQSIYRFRGAEVGNILAFTNQFPGSTVVSLETNYRSSAEVVHVACAVIEQAKTRYEKRLVSALGAIGIPVTLVRTSSEQAEEGFIADAVRNLMRAGTPPSDVAVLHRVHHGLQGIAERFRLNGIPVQRSVSDRSADRAKPGVVMATVHAAKGREFSHVFLPGVEEGTIPHHNAVQEGPEALEEERRLLYVGITRARRSLVLFACDKRTLPRSDRPIVRELSRFVAGLAQAGMFAEVVA